MVAAVVLPPKLDVDACLAFVEAAIFSWIEDARAWLESHELRGERGNRCREAFELIILRPDGVPLIEIAAAMAGVDAWQVWDLLEGAVVGT